MDFDTIEMITTTYFVEEYRREIGMLFVQQRLNNGPSLQTVSDYRSWMHEMLQPELPYNQEVTLRVLQGEPVDGAREKVSAKYYD